MLETVGIALACDRYRYKTPTNITHDPIMWNWLNCYLSGRHDYGVTCDAGSVFLRCLHCGKRSSGWAVHTASRGPVVAPAVTVAGQRHRSLRIVQRTGLSAPPS